MNLGIEILDHLPRPADYELDRHCVVNGQADAADRRLQMAKAFAAKEQAEKHQHTDTDQNPLFHHSSASLKRSRKPKTTRTTGNSWAGQISLPDRETHRQRPLHGP